MYRTTILLVAATLALGGCATTLRQELQARAGPCRSDMVRFRQQLGAPEQTHSRERGSPGRPRMYTVEWSYAERDNLVIRYQWEEGGRYCSVSRDSPYV